MKQQKILVIDDDPDISMMIKMMLEFKGYTVSIAERPDIAEQTLLASQFDLIIMDMLLSGTNGVDVCRQLKKNQQLSGVPIIMISAHPNAKTECAEAGADDFIAKPFDMTDLISTVRRFV